MHVQNLATCKRRYLPLQEIVHGVQCSVTVSLNAAQHTTQCKHSERTAGHALSSILSRPSYLCLMQVNATFNSTIMATMEITV